MTYFTFLGVFLLIPIVILLMLLWRERAWRKHMWSQRMILSAWLVIGIHIVLALIWTTPWDNYLVATGVWWYDPALVSGMTIGYVPIEEYTFFVLQPILTALWLFYLMPHLSRPSDTSRKDASRWRFRGAMTLLLGIVWLIFAGLLLAGVRPMTYLGLELVWALPPIMLQMAFGADILRRQWRLVLSTILSATFFLSLTDAIAIHAGTWTIDPAQSTGILIGGILPVEELIFFLLTNILIVFGCTLALTKESRLRLNDLRSALSQRYGSPSLPTVPGRRAR